MEIYKTSWPTRLWHRFYERLAYGKQALGGTQLTCDEHTLAGSNTRIDHTDILVMDVHYFDREWSMAIPLALLAIFTFVFLSNHPSWLILAAMHTIFAVLWALPMTRLVVTMQEPRRRIIFSIWGDCTHLERFLAQCQAKRHAAKLRKYTSG